MKVMAVAEGERGNDLKESMEARGVSVVLYGSIFKAMDNVEEVAPDYFLLSYENFPRHWKTIALYLKARIFAPCRFILWKEESTGEISYEEASLLNVIISESYEELFKFFPAASFLKDKGQIKNEDCGESKPSLLRKIELLSLK